MYDTFSFRFNTMPNGQCELIRTYKAMDTLQEVLWTMALGIGFGYVGLALAPKEMDKQLQWLIPALLMLALSAYFILTRSRCIMTFDYANGHLRIDRGLLKRPTEIELGPSREFKATDPIKFSNSRAVGRWKHWTPHTWELGIDLSLAGGGSIPVVRRLESTEETANACNEMLRGLCAELNSKLPGRHAQ